MVESKEKNITKEVEETKVNKETEAIEKLKKEKYFEQLLNEENRKILDEIVKDSHRRFIIYGDDEQTKAFIHAYSVIKNLELPYYKSINNYWNRYKGQKTIYVKLDNSNEKDKEVLDILLNKWNGHYPFESYPSKFDKESSHLIIPMFIDLFICSKTEDIFNNDQLYEDFKVIQLE